MRTDQDVSRHPVLPRQILWYNAYVFHLDLGNPQQFHNVFWHRFRLVPYAQFEEFNKQLETEQMFACWYAGSKSMVRGCQSNSNLSHFFVKITLICMEINQPRDHPYFLPYLVDFGGPLLHAQYVPTMQDNILLNMPYQASHETLTAQMLHTSYSNILSFIFAIPT
jgi:hypothetical protein